MALPPIIEDQQREWLLKVTRETSKQPERDLCLLAFFLGTPCTTLEINKIRISHIMARTGRLKTSFVIDGELSSIGEDRTLHLKSKRLVELLESYLTHRVKHKVGMGKTTDYRSLDPEQELFFSSQGAGYSIARRETKKGTEVYACDALNRHIKQLLERAGIESPSIQSGRRTFAVKLKRKGYDIAHIHYLLGNKSLSTTKKLLTSDPVDMCGLMAAAFD